MEVAVDAPIKENTMWRYGVIHSRMALAIGKKLRNVEVKARIEDWLVLVSKARQLAGGKEGTLQEQHDIFFYSPNGRLKMRHFRQENEEHSELIWYDRRDQGGPKLSTYDKITLQKTEAAHMTDLLRQSNGVRGEVKKKRLLFLVGQTRVHCDQVDGLGEFAELEVMLEESQTVEEGEKIAKELMSSLGLSRLVHCAYIDLLLGMPKLLKNV